MDKVFLAPSGLYMGYEDNIGGVTMTRKWIPVENKWKNDLPTVIWYERYAVMSLEDIKTLKKYCYNSLIRNYLKDYGRKRPYLMIQSFMSFMTYRDGGHPDEQHSICLGALQSLMERNPDSIYLDFWPYEREGNPHDWSAWEPLDDRVSIDVMVFDWATEHSDFIAPVAVHHDRVIPYTSPNILDAIHRSIGTPSPMIYKDTEVITEATGRHIISEPLDQPDPIIEPEEEERPQEPDTDRPNFLVALIEPFFNNSVGLLEIINTLNLQVAMWNSKHRAGDTWQDHIRFFIKQIEKPEYEWGFSGSHFWLHDEYRNRVLMIHHAY